MSEEYLLKTYIVTGLYHTEELNDRTLPPRKVQARSRIEAMTSLGATVWTEEEYNESVTKLKEAYPNRQFPEPI